jgi:hypothetical protein
VAIPFPSLSVNLIVSFFIAIGVGNREKEWREAFEKGKPKLISPHPLSCLYQPQGCQVPTKKAKFGHKQFKKGQILEWEKIKAKKDQMVK